MAGEADLETVRSVIDACGQRDVERLRALLRPSVHWLYYAGTVAAGERAADEIVEHLTAFKSESEVNDIVELRPGVVVAWFEGHSIIPDTGTRTSGTSFRSYEIRGGRVERSEPFAYRKDLMARYEIDL